jgi:hypothetical protein
LPIIFSFLSFGIGAKRKDIGNSSIPLLGVKGGSNNPGFTSINWKTPNVPGHYCIQVYLDWRDDANLSNNLGQENVNVGNIHSPAKFEFVLRNETTELQIYEFEVDAYSIPEPEPCAQQSGRKTGKKGSIRLDDTAEKVFVPSKHNRNNYPLPTGWFVEINPSKPELKVNEEIIIDVMVNAPHNYKGIQPLNINAFHKHGYAGGITLYAKNP